MNFSESIKSGFSKFDTWQGRSSRSEFWNFFLFQIIVLIAATILDNVFGTDFKVTNPATGEEQSLVYGYLYTLAAVVMFLPNLAVLIRRFHDTNHSGWWYWLILVPLVGAIVLLIWLCSRGTDGTNRFGEDPLGNSHKDTFR